MSTSATATGEGNPGRHGARSPPASRPSGCGRSSAPASAWPSTTRAQDGRHGPHRPARVGRTRRQPGKFADTAVPHMLGLLRERGMPLYGLTAKFAGGANMFRLRPPADRRRQRRGRGRRLAKAGVRVAGQDVGGPAGRRVEFDCASGEMTVQCAGRPARSSEIATIPHQPCYRTK